MYALEYPNSDSCDKKLDTSSVFKVTEVKGGNFDYLRRLFFSPVARSFKSPEHYKWGVMATDPEYSNDYMININEDIEPRDEVARLLYDIGTAMQSRYNLKMRKIEDAETPVDTSTDPYKAPDVLKKYFFYENALFSGEGISTFARIFPKSEIPPKILNQMINPNLDAGYPVLLDIAGEEFGKLTSHSSAQC